MEKEFVTHEIALALKELGFDEECLGWYNFKNSDNWLLLNQILLKIQRIG